VSAQIFNFPVARAAQRPLSQHQVDELLHGREAAHRLSKADVQRMTTFDATTMVFADPDDGTLAVEDAVAHQNLIAVLDFHGLQLPPEALAEDVLQMCVELRWTYGQAIRLAAAHRLDIGQVCPHLNPTQVLYSRMAGEQDRRMARLLARQVFNDARWRPFVRGNLS